MLDVRRFRTDADAVRAGLARRGEDLAQVDRVIELDVEVRRISTERDELRSRIRSLSHEVGQLHRDGRKEEAGELQAESRALGQEEQALDGRAAATATGVRVVLFGIAN